MSSDLRDPSATEVTRARGLRRSCAKRLSLMIAVPRKARNISWRTCANSLSNFTYRKGSGHLFPLFNSNDNRTSFRREHRCFRCSYRHDLTDNSHHPNIARVGRTNWWMRTGCVGHLHTLGSCEGHLFVEAQFRLRPCHPVALRERTSGMGFHPEPAGVRSRKGTPISKGMRGQ